MSAGRASRGEAAGKLGGPGLAFSLVVGVALSLAALSLAGCNHSAPAAQAPPPAPVTVAHPVQREVTEWDTYTGYLEAVESVNVSARVSGLIMEAPFTEGSIVKKSQVLFVIDERPFKADLDLKVADLERAKAQLTIAQLNFRRQQEAITSKAVSQQDYDNAKATQEQAQATLAGAQAAVDLAKLNVEWCRVTSPIDGRVSSKMVTVGNLINGGAGAATLLTTIQSISPIYCYFDVDEHSVLKYQKLAAENKRMSEREGKVPCYLRLSNETTYSHPGYVDFVDNHVDATTGTMRVRGVFVNDSGQLTPGYFASLRIPGSGKYTALLVPDTAVGNDQSERTVMVVNKDNKVEVRRVKLGALFGDLRSIESGLKTDDRVVINGLMRARPGAPVAPTEAAIKVDPAVFAQVDASGGPSAETNAPAAAAPAAPAAPASSSKPATGAESADRSTAGTNQ